VIRAVQCTAPIRDSFVQFPELHLSTAYGHIGPKAVRTRDTSALVRQFGPNGETVRTVCLDTSVLEPGHIGSTALLPKCPATAPMGEHCRDSALIKDFTQCTHCIQCRCLCCLLTTRKYTCVSCAKFLTQHRHCMQGNCVKFSETHEKSLC